MKPNKNPLLGYLWLLHVHEDLDQLSDYEKIVAGESLEGCSFTIENFLLHDDSYEAWAILHGIELRNENLHACDPLREGELSVINQTLSKLILAYYKSKFDPWIQDHETHRQGIQAIFNKYPWLKGQKNEI